jgi:LysM repeat protein
MAASITDLPNSRNIQQITETNKPKDSSSKKYKNSKADFHGSIQKAFDQTQMTQR